MAHTYTKNHIHIIFSTKAREKRISKQLQPKLWSYMAGICRKMKIVALAIGGIEDHVHALVELPPSMSVSKAVNLLKSNSSRWMNEHGKQFAWQEGFGAFSVSASNIPAVKRYVLNQAAHQENDVLEGIYYVSQETRHSIRLEVRSGIVPPRRGSLFFLRFPRPYGLGYRYDAPPALGLRTLRQANRSFPSGFVCRIHLTNTTGFPG